MGNSPAAGPGGIRAIADEQAALRRVATLVARAAPSAEVFAAVAEEVGRLLAADRTLMSRYEPGDTVTIVAEWRATGEIAPSGYQTPIFEGSPTALVRATGRPARIDRYPAGSAMEALAGTFDIRSAVVAPIIVEGRLWGCMIVASTTEQPPPPATEGRLAGFTELAATAVAHADAREKLRRVADEETALRRVATLVAQGAPPEQLFASVAAEVGRMLDADFALLSRYERGGAATIVGAWVAADDDQPVPIGTRVELGGRNVHTLVFQAGRPARIDDYAEASGASAEVARGLGSRSGAGVPINVDGRLWGVMYVASRHEQPLPADTEDRLAGFTELVATAVANAQARTELIASRARIVAAADAIRQRIERDLHDGAQQRLVSLGLQLRSAQAALPPGAGELSRRLDDVADGLTGLADELREYARGIHPAILAEGGLGPALKALARRSSIPVHLDVRTRGRLPEPREVCAYYVVSEALTNAAKHSNASAITVRVAADDDLLSVRVCDNGVGGASFDAGSGLVGLKDRVEALGGQFVLDSKTGDGTCVSAQLPLGTGYLASL